MTKQTALDILDPDHNSFSYYDSLKSIENEYYKPGRFYHNWDHIVYMFNSLPNDYEISNELFWAIILHDVVYIPGASDNEEKSCIWARHFLQNKEVDVNRVCSLIMLTKDHNPKYINFNHTDEKFWMVYLDLKSLIDCDHLIMLKNDQKLFKEFQKTPLHNYKKGRMKFLSDFYYKFRDKLKDGNKFLTYLEILQEQTYNIGIYCGSFDPMHIGHKNIVNKAEKVFDKVILGVGQNPEKTRSTNYSIVHEKNPNQVIEYQTIFSLFKDLKEKNPNDKFTLIRGLRNEHDMPAEENFRKWVKEYSNNSIDIVYFFCCQEYEHISSSQLKNLEKSGLDIKRYLV